MSSTKEKIRVLRIINRFNLGGPTFNVAYLSKYLDDRFETLLVGGIKDESEASSEFITDSLGLKPKTISEMKRSISLSADWRSYKEINQIIKDFKPHIVHTHAAKSGTLGRLAAIKNDVPVILHTFHGHVFHSYFNRIKTTIFKVIERYLAKHSTRIIAISNIQKKELGELHRIASPDRIEVVPLGFDLSRFQEDQSQKRAQFRATYNLNENDVAVGIIGRLVPIKNHEMFLKAVANISIANPKARFFITGDGESKQHLLGVAKSLGIGYTEQAPPSQESPLCFTSWIREIDVVMAGLDIVSLCSLNEGTPVSLIEAQSATKPVVSTTVGGIEDIVIENQSALLCSVEDQGTFDAHLETLILNDAKRQEMGEVGKRHVIDKYSYVRLVSDMENLYSTLLRENGVVI
ncbi:MAG: glycosyltransferase [Flavobacteriales bacterium]|nr:glycosyltransferase [Flavobacteriales bacterium]MBT6132964.1 glycosyltransferase [Flavobacteriales bacterium]